MSDRICVMSRGKALQIGTPIEIYERPNCQFVADFIGETNFLHGKVTEVRGEYATVQVEDRSFVGRVADGAPVQNGASVVMSVRPEKIQLYDDGKADPGKVNTYPVTISSVAYVGSDTRVIIQLGKERLDVWDENNVSTLDPNFYYRSGERAWLSFPPDNALVLVN